MTDRAHRPPTLVRIACSCLLLSLTFSLVAWTRADAQRRTQARRAAPRPAATPARLRFSHGRREHQQACDKCHQFPSPDWKEARAGEAAFPDVTRQPEHASCLSCHRRQFFARERPAPRICSVCHVAATPRNLARLPFPNPPETFDRTERARDFSSDFRIGFPHDKHLELVGGLTAPGRGRASGVRFVTASFRPAARPQESDPKSCAVCHQTHQPQGKSASEYATEPPKDLGERFWLKKGTFKTAPNHAGCFTCHSQDSGLAPAPNDCAACHKLAPSQPPDFDSRLAASMNVADGTALRRWRTRYSSGTFPHDGGGHADLACTTCHDAAKMNTLDPKSTSVPLETCAACHITATADEGGALNVEADKRKADAAFQCTKCHVAYGRAPVPESHTKALAAAK